ncbi:MAG: M15 family metallopeptidase [Actinomycetota bacterium]
MDPVGLDTVRSRIAALGASTDSAATAQRSLGSTAEFDAFGEAYQAALARRDGGAPIPPANGAGSATAAGTTPGTPFTGSAGSTGAAGSMASFGPTFAGSTVGATGGSAGFPTTSRLDPGRVIATPTGTRYPTGTGSAYGSGGTVLVGTMSSGVPGLPGVDDARLLAAIEGRAAAPGARSVGGYGRLEPPAVLKAIGNGRLPPSTLTPLTNQSYHELYAPAAAAWDNLVATAAADGIEIRITDSYRDYDEQVDLVRRKGLYSEGGLGARPGTSNHGWGLAVDADVTDRATYEWLSTHGPRFGWVESVPREPWHWEFRPGQV